MIRPFRLSDWGLLNRLSDRSVPLNAALVLTQTPAPQWGALLHRLIWRNYPTYVWRPANGNVSAFAQLRFSRSKTQASFIWIGASIPSNRSFDRDGGEVWTPDVIWQALIEELAVYLGWRGVQSLIAEVREDSPEADVLRDAGFANYSRQEIYKLEAADLNARRPALMQPRRRTDDWDVELLYAHVVPNMIRMIEPHPPLGRDSWVHYEKQELAAYAHVATGRLANWLRLFVHMNAEANARQLVNDVVNYKPPQPDRPLYCCVRHYQSWLDSPLRANGFTRLSSQQVMVRHTVQAVKRPVSRLESVLQSGGAPAQPTSWVRNRQTGRKLPNPEPEPVVRQTAGRL